MTDPGRPLEGLKQQKKNKTHKPAKEQTSPAHAIGNFPP
jgi:hypothetical protein